MTFNRNWFRWIKIPIKYDREGEVEMKIRDLMQVFCKAPLGATIKLEQWDDHRDSLEDVSRVVLRNGEVIFESDSNDEEPDGEILWSSSRPVINTQSSTSPDNAGESKQICLELGSTLKLSDSINSPKD